MPLFNRKFESKPIPPRSGRCNNSLVLGQTTGTAIPATINEEMDDFKNISLNLGNKELRFADGIWIHSTRKGDVDDILRLNNKIKNVEEENNMCHLKIEVLLDLLAEHASELSAMKTKEK